jgi:hypothetical protein
VLAQALSLNDTNIQSAEELAVQCQARWLFEDKEEQAFDRIVALARSDKQYLVAGLIPTNCFVDVPANVFYGSLPNIFFHHGTQPTVHLVAAKEHIASFKRTIAENLQQYAVEKGAAAALPAIKKRAQQFAEAVLGRTRLGAHFYSRDAEMDLVTHIDGFCDNLLKVLPENAGLVSEV